ncbi:MAG: SLC13 family permease, partial [Sporomusa sp.]
MDTQLVICLLIFAFTIISYCWGKLSMATTAMLSMILLNVTGCLDATTTLSYFGNGTVIMVASMCIVAAGFNRTQFCMNMANRISHVAKGSMVKILAGYCLIAMILSQFIQSPAAVIGIIAPMAAVSIEKININPSKIMFPIGVTAIVTCCTLPIGAGATIAAELNGYLESYGYTDYVVGLADPMKARLPLLVITLIYMVFVAPRFAPEVNSMPLSEGFKIDSTKAPLKPFQERAGYIIFIISSVALMFADAVNMEAWQICMLGALAMVIFGVLSPKEATSALPMNILLLIAGALAMAGALTTTGAGELLGTFVSNVVDKTGGNSYLVGLMFFIIPFILTQVMNNRATMLIFYPIAIATCAVSQANPVGLMILIQAACLSAFMTPMATPGVPFFMAAGGYNLKDVFKQSW